jgi:hypothetical protein
MPPDEFPGNSRRQRDRPQTPEPKKVERVVQSQVGRRKRSLGKRMSEAFVGGDARGVWNFVALDVLIPAAKDMLADAISQGFERLIFGEARSRSRSGRRPGESYVNYNRYSRDRRDDPRDRPTMSHRARAAHDFDEIIIGTRVEAEEVLDRMFDIVNRYDCATVADLYDLVGIQGAHTDEKWGWNNLAGAGVTRVRNGYLLDLPRPEPLD